MRELVFALFWLIVTILCALFLDNATALQSVGTITILAWYETTATLIWNVQLEKKMVTSDEEAQINPIDIVKWMLGLRA